MSHVFLSYKREDETRVARIAGGLAKAGIEVWWDKALPNAESYQTSIETNLDAAGCVVVVWSAGSMAPEGSYVRDEARRGLARGVLVPVLIDKVGTIPLGFGELQAIDLTRWKGDPHDPFFQDLVASVRAKLDGKPAPRPRGPAARVTRRLIAGGVGSAALGLVSALAMNAFNMTAQICTVPAGQPGLSDACGAIGLGRRPSRAERVAWAARPVGSCEALKAHINRFPQGAYRDEAVALLAARAKAYRDSWTPATRQLVLYSPADGPAAPNATAARTLAIARATSDAARLCRGFGAGSLFRFVSATVTPETWACSSLGAGSVCGFDGHANCNVEERHVVEQDRCGGESKTPAQR
jgi:hypothetical protein